LLILGYRLCDFKNHRLTFRYQRSLAAWQFGQQRQFQPLHDRLNLSQMMAVNGSFAVLRTVIEYELALHKAFVADIVVVSAHGGKALPNIVKHWLKQWFGRKSDEPCALMVSFSEGSRDSASAAQIVSSLQAESKARDVAVFPCFSETSYSDSDPTVQTNQRPEGYVRPGWLTTGVGLNLNRIGASMSKSTTSLSARGLNLQVLLFDLN